MCSFPAVAMAGLQIGGNYLSQKAQASATQSYLNQQATAAITEMNYSLQNYEHERTDAFDAAVEEITKTRQNALQLNSGVKAAVNENMSGRTANLIVRATEGDTARAVSSIQDNYRRKSNEISLNKESAIISAKTTLDNLNASVSKTPSRLANFVSSAATGLEAYTMGMNQKNSVLSTGQSYNWWTGGAKSSGTNYATKTYVGTVPLTVYKKNKTGTVQWWLGDVR